MNLNLDQFWSALSAIAVTFAALSALYIAKKDRRFQAKITAHSKKQHIAERITAKVLTLKKDANAFEIAVKLLIKYAKAGKSVNIDFDKLMQLSSFPNNLELISAYIDLYFEREKLGHNWNKSIDLFLAISKISGEMRDLIHVKIKDPNLAELLQARFDEFLELKSDLDTKLVNIRNFLVADLGEFDKRN